VTAVSVALRDEFRVDAERRLVLSCEEESSSSIRSLIPLAGASAIVATRLLASPLAATRSLPRSIPSFARLPLPGFNSTKALIAG
jgi:hypothetical protein